MSVLAVPVSPLSHTKRRLAKVLSNKQLEELTLAMVKDFCKKTLDLNCFSEKIVYCYTPQVLELSEEYGFCPIREEAGQKSDNFNDVITQMNNIILNKFNPENVVISFVDLILISPRNLIEIKNLLEKNQLVICPSVHSLGISIIGRNPPDVIDTCFSPSDGSSLIAQIQLAKKNDLKKIALYDSFRAGFDVDLKEHLKLGYEFLKIFNLTDSETYKFMQNHLKTLLK